jgi:sulfur relay (sulfurtransferase) DsrC/TusE family protein
MVYLRYEYNPTFIKKDISEQISEALRDYWNTSRLLEYFEIIGILRDYWNTSRLLEYFEIIGILRDYWYTSYISPVKIHAKVI